MRESSLLKMTAARRGGSEMGLWDFIQKRMEELGITQYDLEAEYGIAYATLQRIKAGKPIKEGTKQKLALALKCSIGDINAAIAGTPAEPDGHEMDLLAEESGEPSVMDTVDKLERMVKEEYPELAEKPEPKRNELTATDVNWKVRQAQEAEPVIKLTDKAIKRKKEKQAEKQQITEVKLRFTKNDPPPKEKWPEDPPEEQKTVPPDYLDARLYAAAALPDVFGIEKARQEAVTEYKQKLKDICLRTYVGMPTVNLSGETPAGMIGRALMEELLKDDTGAK